MKKLYDGKILDREHAVVHGAILFHLRGMPRQDTELTGLAERILAQHARYKDWTQRERQLAINREITHLVDAGVLVSRPPLLSISDGHKAGVEALFKRK